MMWPLKVVSMFCTSTLKFRHISRQDDLAISKIFSMLLESTLKLRHIFHSRMTWPLRQLVCY